MSEPQRITSRDNALLVRARKLARTPGGYRKQDSLWLEGEHLCKALRARGRAAAQAIVSETAWQDASLRTLAQSATHAVVIPDALFGGVSPLESPAGIAFIIDVPQAPALQPGAPTVVLDRVQDAGNVGSILRSAAALGYTQVLALEGTALLWSPKVVRAGMGAHFALDLVEGCTANDLGAITVPLLAASSHAAASLAEADLPFPCSWVFGHEGQGIAPAVLAHCAQTLRIPQPGGEESLNVAAAAAICLHAARGAAEWPR